MIFVAYPDRGICGKGEVDPGCSGLCIGGGWPPSYRGRGGRLDRSGPGSVPGLRGVCLRAFSQVEGCASAACTVILRAGGISVCHLL